MLSSRTLRMFPARADAFIPTAYPIHVLENHTYLNFIIPNGTKKNSSASPNPPPITTEPQCTRPWVLNLWADIRSSQGMFEANDSRLKQRFIFKTPHLHSWLSGQLLFYLSSKIFVSLKFSFLSYDVGDGRIAAWAVSSLSHHPTLRTHWLYLNLPQKSPIFRPRAHAPECPSSMRISVNRRKQVQNILPLAYWIWCVHATL